MSFHQDIDKMQLQEKIKIPENSYRKKYSEENLPIREEKIALEEEKLVLEEEKFALKEEKIILKEENIKLASDDDLLLEEDYIITNQNFVSVIGEVKNTKEEKNTIMNPIGKSEEINLSNLNNKQSDSLIPEDFNFKAYKYEKCSIGESCQGCNRYHYEGEKRRELEKIQYGSVLCPRLEHCYNQDRCAKAHNLMELYYHPHIYQAYKCPYPKKNEQCIFGKFCNCFHLIDEKNVESQPTIKCKICLTENICMARVNCGHTFCKNCSIGIACRRCKVPGDVIKIEL